MDKQTKIILLIILVIIMLFFLTRHNENLNEKEDGEKCTQPLDCKSGKCNINGTCGYLPNDMKCGDDSECISRVCHSDTKKCIDLLEDKKKCSRDAECISGMCLTTGKINECHPKLKVDSDCKRDMECENRSCINKKCQEKIVDNSAQECNADDECQSNACNFITKKCGLSDTNLRCNRHKECTTGYCTGKPRVCTVKPSI